MRTELKKIVGKFKGRMLFIQLIFEQYSGVEVSNHAQWKIHISLHISPYITVLLQPMQLKSRLFTGSHRFLKNNKYDIPQYYSALYIYTYI